MKINLGCGSNPIKEWVNIDLETKPGIMKYDLSNGSIPATTNSVDFIFSEHFIEHIRKSKLEALLRDCLRSLVPGGWIRLSTPDLEFLCSEYLRGKPFQIPGVWEPKTPCQSVNEGLRSWGHKYVYDFPELELLLSRVGFADVRRVNWRDSVLEELRCLESRPYFHDLIVEAKKPGTTRQT